MASTPLYIRRQEGIKRFWLSLGVNTPCPKVVLHDETSWEVLLSTGPIVVDGEPLSPEKCAGLRGLYRRAEHEVHLGITVSRLLLGRKARSELGRRKRIAAVWVLAHELAHALPGPCREWSVPATTIVQAPDEDDFGWERQLGEGLATLLGISWTLALAETMGFGYLRTQIALDQGMWANYGDYTDAVWQEVVSALPVVGRELNPELADALIMQLAAIPPVFRVAELDLMIERADRRDRRRYISQSASSSQK